MLCSSLSVYASTAYELAEPACVSTAECHRRTRLVFHIDVPDAKQTPTKSAKQREKQSGLRHYDDGTLSRNHHSLHNNLEFTKTLHNLQHIRSPPSPQLHNSETVHGLCYVSPIPYSVSRRCTSRSFTFKIVVHQDRILARTHRRASQRFRNIPTIHKYIR